MKYSRSFFIILLVGIVIQKSLYADWSDYQKAIESFQKASFDSAIYFAKKVDSSDTLFFYSQFLIGHAYLELDSLELAKDKFESLLKDSNNRFQVYNGLGLYHLYKYDKTRAMKRILKKLFSTDDLDRAKELFERAIRLQPDYLDAKLNKCRALLAASNPDETNAALNILRILNASYPNNIEILFYLGETYRSLNIEYEATEVFIQILNMNEWHSGANLSLAYIYLEQEEYKLFSRYYLKSLRFMYDQRMMRKLYYDIYDILSDKEKKYAESQRLTGIFFIQFWKMRDPIPITVENERLIEHYKRLDIARIQYLGSRKSGYDDRGKIYVRYGEPDDVSRSLIQDGYTLENESWIYQINGQAFNFDFVNEGSGYVLKRDLSNAITNPDFRVAVLNLQELYSRRAHLSNYYANIYQELLQVNPSTTTGSIMSVSSIVNRYSAQETLRRERLPRSIYEVHLEGSDLKFDFDTFTFYNHSQKKWFIDIFYGLNLAQIDYNFRDAEYLGELQQKLRILSSSSIVPLEFYRDIKLVSRNNFSNTYYVNKVTAPLFDAMNQIHFQLKNEASKKFRIIEKMKTISYSDSLLTMSEILLSSDIHLQNPQDDTLYCKNDYYIHPIPSRQFSQENPVYCYFELYYIVLDEQSIGRCQIETRIQEHETGKNLSSFLSLLNPFGGSKSSRTAVSILNEYEFKDRFESIVVAFDVSKFNSGIYKFFIKVTDLNSDHTVLSNKLLQLTD